MFFAPRANFKNIEADYLYIANYEMFYEIIRSICILLHVGHQRVKPDFCPNYAGFFRKKPDSGSGKPDTRSRNLFVLKHIWVKVSISWEFQPNRSNNTLKTGFFRISGKSGSRIRIFFGLKPSRDQDGANKKKFSQIGPAVPEEIGRKQANTQTSCCYIREIL